MPPPKVTELDEGTQLAQEVGGLPSSVQFEDEQLPASVKFEDSVLPASVQFEDELRLDMGGDGFSSAPKIGGLGNLTLSDVGYKAPLQDGTLAPASYGQPALTRQQTGDEALMQEFAPLMGKEANPLAGADWALGKFKQHLISPILKLGQDAAREFYETKTAYPALREKLPGAAILLEQGMRHVIGETPFNTRNPDEVAKQAVDTRDAAAQEFGENAAGFIDMLSYEGANLPIFLLNGWSKNEAMQGVQAGVTSALLDPEQSSAATAGLFGGAGGVAIPKLLAVGGKLAGEFGGLLKGGGANWNGVAPKPIGVARRVVPIAVVPPEKLDELAEAVARNLPEQLDEGLAELAPTKLQPQATPSKHGQTTPGRGRPKPLMGVVDVAADGTPVLKVLTGSGVGATARKVDHFPADIPILATPSAQSAQAANPGGAVDQAFWQVGPDGVTAAKGQWMPAHERIENLQDWDASQNTGTREGLVLVLEGGGGNGTARLHQINSPTLQKEVLRARELMEVTLQDGTKHVGFYAPGGMVRPDVDEFIPGAAQFDLALDGNADIKSLRLVTKDSELDELLLRRERLKSDAADARARLEADTAAEQADIQAGGDGSGGNLPPGPPQHPPPPPPPGPHNMDPSDGVKFPWAAKALANINRKLLNPTVRGAQDAADLAFTSHSVDTFERLRSDVLTSFNRYTPEIRQMPMANQRATLQTINRYLDGDLTLNQLKGLHPELNASVSREVDKYKGQIATNHQQLQRLGMLASDEKLAAGLDLDSPEELADYATRMYYRYLMKPGEWARMFKKDIQAVESIKRAIKDDVYRTKAYTGEKADGKSSWTEADRDALAADHLDYLLGTPEMMARAKASPEGAWKQAVSLAGGSLQHRRDMTWWKKAALGEVDNPFVRIAESMARQKQLIVTGEMMQAVASNPNMSSAGDDVGGAAAKGHTEWVDPVPSLYGKMAGRRVSPEAWEAIVQAPLAQRNQATTMSKFINAMKWNQTVGNPGSWMTNFFANSQGVMLSNLVNPFASPFKVGKGMLLFTRDLKAHKLAPGISGDVSRDRFTRAMELGIVGSDYSTAEFREAASLWERTLEGEAGRNGGRVNPLSMFPRILKQGKDALSRKYGAIDTLWKYAAYTSGLEKGGIDLTDGTIDVKKVIKFIGARYRVGMDNAALKTAAELEVAQRIHYSFPMLDRVGEGVAKASQVAGLANPYLKVKIELMRNYAQLPGRVIREPGMLANLMSYTALVGGAYFGMKELRSRAGINQDEVDAAFASAPDAVQRFKPGAMALWDRASNGKVRLLDMTQMFEPLTWLQGNPESAVATRFLQNLILASVDGSLLEPELASKLAESGMFDAAYARPNVPLWQQGGVKLFSESVGRLGPGLFRNVYATAERGGIGFAPKGSRGPDAPTATPGTTAFNLVAGPNRLVESGGKDDRTRAIKSRVRELEAAVRALEAIGPKNEGQSTGTMSMPLDKADAKLKARAILDQKKAELKKLQTILGR